MNRRRFLLSLVAALPLTAACASPGVSLVDVRRLVAFIEDGRTSKAALHAHAGAPSRQYRDGAIWTYQGDVWFRLDDGTLRERVKYDEFARYHLVIVFDALDVVKAHRIVDIK